jgi:aspartate aminotransferase
VQAISGTGALRLCAQFLQRFKPGTAVFISNPTWGPHRTIFTDAGLGVQEYPYWDPKARGIDFGGMSKCINGAPEGSVFVLHACAHNPTGCDPSREQWHELAALLKAKGHIVVFDCAYQGFASGSLDDDAYAVRHFVESGLQLFVAQSYSKNFGLYNERCGALVAVCGNPEEARAVRSQLCKLQRALISNPPAFGARIVSRILNDPALYAEWMANLATMVTRIKAMRRALYDELVRLGTPGKWEHVISQIGMFSYTGLSKAQSTVMKERFHIYLTDNGRISIAGLTSKNIKYFAESMDWVVRNVHD